MTGPLWCDDYYCENGYDDDESDCWVLRRVYNKHRKFIGWRRVYISASEDNRRRSGGRRSISRRAAPAPARRAREGDQRVDHGVVLIAATRERSDGDGVEDAARMNASSIWNATTSPRTR